MTLSGVIQLPPGITHLPLTTALQLALRAVRVVVQTHDRGQIVGVLDAAHFICAPNGAMSIGGQGGNPVAPEIRLGGAPGKLTDIYALGALTYRLLTGRQLQRARVIEPPSHVNPAVDSSLDELVLAALDDDPAQRPPSAREFEARLGAICEELGLEDTHTEADQLIAKKVAAAPVPKPAPKPAPTARQPATTTAMKTAAPKPAPRRVVSPEPDDVEAYDDDDDFDYRSQASGPLDGVDRKWLIGGGAALALLLLLVAWPSGKKSPKPAHKQAEIAKPVEAPSIKVQAYLVKTQPAAVPPMKIKLATREASRPAPARAERRPATAEPASDDSQGDYNPVLPPDERERAAGQAEQALQE